MAIMEFLQQQTTKKMLKEKNTNKERKDSNIKVRLPSLRCPSLRFGGDVWGRCKVSQDCLMLHHINHLF